LLSAELRADAPRRALGNRRSLVGERAERLPRKKDLVDAGLDCPTVLRAWPASDADCA
jgi:hypothetical protein